MSLRLTLFGLAGLLSSCASILGIEEATCDPEQDPRCNEGFDASVDDDDIDDDSVDDDDTDDDDTDDDDDTGDDDDTVDPTTFMDQESLCSEYCRIMDSSCTEENGGHQYATFEACSEICTEGLTFGEPFDDDVDTAFCRYHNALQVGVFGEDIEFCAAAGLGAEGTCGDICEVYCSQLFEQCQAEPAVADVAIVQDPETCLAECRQLPREAPFVFSIDSGNSLDCRLWHIQATYGIPSTHCPHAAGLAVCVP